MPQGLPAITAAAAGAQTTRYSLSLEVLALVTTITLLPSLLLMMTSFVRILIVMSLLRMALGTAQTPPNMVLVGLALFLTIFIMSPILSEVYGNAIVPYLDETLSFDEAIKCFTMFFKSEFEGGRHQARLEKFNHVESTK